MVAGAGGGPGLLVTPEQEGEKTEESAILLLLRMVGWIVLVAVRNRNPVKKV